MQKSAADIEIALATRHEHQRSRGIDCDTEKRNPDDGSRRDFGGIVEPLQASQAIAPTETRRKIALNNAARIDVPRSP